MTSKERVLAILHCHPVDRLPRGSVEQVRAEVKDCLQTLGAGREGFICCSCHNVQPGTSIENILTMVETVRNS